MIRKSLLTVLYLISLHYVESRKWNYEPISLESHTANTDKLDINMYLKRMPYGEFGYEGYMNFAYDVNDDAIVETVAYRSPSGREEDYTLMPWSIPSQPFSKFIEDFYEETIYPNFAGCSNLPKPENVLPWKMGNATFKECVVAGEGLPEMAPQGYYKVIFTVTGEVEWGFVSVARITDKLMP